MDRRILKRIVVGWLFLLIAAGLLGKVSVAAPNAGRTAAEFLLIGGDASSAAMGGGYTALCEGAVASYWNPAGLTSLEGGEVFLSHFATYQDMRFDQGAVAFSLNDRMVLAGSIAYLGYGNIDGYDASGYATGDVSAYDWAGAVSFGYQATPALSLGLTGKFINQRLDDLSASSFAADLGFKFRQERFAVGGVIANLGPDMKFESVKEKLPITARLGLYGTPFNRAFVASIEMEKRAHGDLIIHNGYEVVFRDQYFLRTGYSLYANQDKRGLGGSLTIGAGLKLNRLQVDYAFTPGDDYTSESLHRFSLAFKFGD